MRPSPVDLLAVTPDEKGERFDTLLAGEGPWRLERIVSSGQASPPSFWYDQEEDEWVTLLSGEATILLLNGDGSTETVDLVPGRALLLPAHRRHRVAKTSVAPPCVWLALHGTFK